MNENFTPTYADFYWGNENGEHRMKFDMSVSIVDIRQKKVTKDKLIATWPVDNTQRLKVSNIKEYVIVFYSHLESGNIVRKISYQS